MEYLYQSTHVHNFKDNPCRTSQPEYLWRRINLGPIQMKGTKSYKYGPLVIVTLCLTATSAMVGALGKLILFGTKMYPVIKRKCCKRKQRRDSTVELQEGYERIDDVV